MHFQRNIFENSQNLILRLKTLVRCSNFCMIQTRTMKILRLAKAFEHFYSPFMKLLCRIISKYFV